MTIETIAHMQREILNRCRDLDLKVDCGIDGIFNAEIAIIGEAPGDRERIMKMPLVGQSGKFLFECFRKVGINRRMVYMSNVVKRQLLAVDESKVKISRNEVDQYAQILKWELEQLPNLKYIICLGNYALEAVTGLSGITHHRGSVYTTTVRSISQGTSRDVTVMAMFNPAAVLREPKWEVIFNFDVGRLDRVLKGDYKEHVVTPIINPSPQEAHRWLEKMRDEKLPVALDIETIGNETACIGLANDIYTGMCINFRDRTKNLFSTLEETVLRIDMQNFVADEQTRLVMQNGMFDSYWLAYKDRLMLGRSYFDTMLAHHTLYPSLPHNLGFLTSQYTEHPFYKDDGKEWREGGDIDTFWNYNVKDCCITLAVFQRELKELSDQRLDKFFFQHVMRLQPHLIGMTIGGIKADVELKQQIAEDTAILVKKLKAEFHELVHEATGDDEYNPNPASPKQMADLYFTKLRLVGRGTATDVKNREKMKAHPRTPDVARRMIDKQNDLAKEQKFLGTYAEMTIDDDGRIRCEYKQTGVASAPGRLSSTSVMWGSGTNLQNQPGRAHKMFVADQGYGFSYFDLSQAEARVVGWKYDIEAWIKQFEQARIDGVYDAHRALAVDMFGVPYEQVPTVDWDDDGKPTIRYKAKRCRHGLNYRMGVQELADQLGVSYNEAEFLHRQYHRITPELEHGWNETIKEVRRTRSLYNAYGRRWVLLERFDDEALKPIVAFYPQSTIGDKVSRCIYLCESDPDWPVGRARMALNIHDALIALHDLEPDVTQAVQHVMKKHAEEPIQITSISGVQRELIVPADLKQSVPDERGVHRWSTITEKVKIYG